MTLATENKYFLYQSIRLKLLLLNNYLIRIKTLQHMLVSMGVLSKKSLKFVNLYSISVKYSYKVVYILFTI